MRSGQTVSYDTLDRAFGAVQDEFIELGVLHDRSRLWRTDVVWCRIPQIHVGEALGFCFDRELSPVEQAFGYRAGNIYIPHLVPFHLFWQRRGSLRAILRHEYAHAIAYHYPGFVRRSRAFRQTFGGTYDGKFEAHNHAPEEAYVSDYATTSPAEDFAESFCFWITHRKNQRTRGGHHLLRKKFSFVQTLIKRLARS